MQRIRTEHVIAAPPARVFAALVDFATWSAWNPVIPKIRGEARLGSAVRFRIVIPGLPALSLKAKLTTLERDRRIAWSGGMSAVLHGEHYFEVSPDGTAGDRTRLVHGEDFTGALSRLMPASVVAKITKAYATVNAALGAELDQNLVRARTP